MQTLINIYQVIVFILGNIFLLLLLAMGVLALAKWDIMNQLKK